MGGHGANHDAMLSEADLLGRHGYGALTLETRACAGALATLGYREVEDLQAMADFTEKQPGVIKLGALGFSAGSATIIRGAARLPQIGTVVAEGNYINHYEEITAVAAPPQSLEWQIQRLVAVAYALTVGVWPGEVSPVWDLPAISPRPLLLIHGEKEMGRTRGQEQFAAAGEPKTLWVVPGAGHGEYYKVQPKEYEKRVVEFFDRYLRLTF
ncbi:MAG TPA: hypothetical protein VF313_10290 [Anaerolineaceae bacterium]